MVGSLQQDFRDPPSFVMFEVNITGSPRPDVSWSHDGEEIVVKGRSVWEEGQCGASNSSGICGIHSF